MDLEPWSVQQAARYRQGVGDRIAERDGVLWTSSGTRFWRPVDLLTPVPETARPPRAPMMLGWHAPTTGSAKRAVPLKVIPDLGGYTPTRIARKARQDLRRCLSAAEIELASDPTSLQRSGYQVWVQARCRTGQWAPADAQSFQRLVSQRWEHGPQIVATGSRDGELGGFLLAHLIGANCYFDQVVISDQALRWRLGVGLYWTALQAAKNAGASTAWLGFWEPDMPTIAAFKKHVGAVVTPTPARSGFAPGLGAYLRRRRPTTYLRLAGMPSGFPSANLDDTVGATAVPGREKPLRP